MAGPWTPRGNRLYKRSTGGARLSYPVSYPKLVQIPALPCRAASCIPLPPLHQGAHPNCCRRFGFVIRGSGVQIPPPAPKFRSGEDFAGFVLASTAPSGIARLQIAYRVDTPGLSPVSTSQFQSPMAAHTAYQEGRGVQIPPLQFFFGTR